MNYSISRRRGQCGQLCCCAPYVRASCHEEKANSKRNLLVEQQNLEQQPSFKLLLPISAGKYPRSNRCQAFRDVTQLILHTCYCAGKRVGPVRDLNPGPRAPEARIIPLDQLACDTLSLLMGGKILPLFFSATCKPLRMPCEFFCECFAFHSQITLTALEQKVNRTASVRCEKD